MASSVSSKADLLRQELNLKNLRRHDDTIQSILATASYVTVYRNLGDGWVKSGIEGPMFLFERSSTPQHGFFVLNRNGLEYVQEYLTSDSEVKIEGEFLLYEPGEQAERATGLWIAEEKDRTELCRQMVDICDRTKRLAASWQQPPAPSPASNSISLDQLFGSAASFAGASPSVMPAMAPRQPQQAPVSPVPSARVAALDMLFSSAASPPPPRPATRPPTQFAVATIPTAPSPSSAPDLLNKMFLSAAQRQQRSSLPVTSSLSSSQPGQQASPTPLAAPRPPPATQSQSPPNDARALLAMLGHPNGLRSGSTTTSTQIVDGGPGSSSDKLSQALSKTLNASASPTSSVANGQQRPSVAATTGVATGSSSSTINSIEDLLGRQGLGQATTNTTGIAQQRSVATSQPISARETRTLTSASELHSRDNDSVTKPKKSTTPQPKFAPPLLSHDLFDQLPLPGSNKQTNEPSLNKTNNTNGLTKGEVAAQGAQARLNGHHQHAEPRDRRQDAVSEPVSHSNDEPSIQTPGNTTATRVQQALTEPPLDKSNLLQVLDELVTRDKVGMERVEQGVTVGQKEFIRKVEELLKKPAFATSLYARYLERCDED
ncbi:hypothetical protein OIO90_004236 [Microbotryomycetes sp. JL221]|nr:hypothetical protein OIO90_004236 [Microbotryomycetes sp. JL221]